MTTRNTTDYVTLLEARLVVHLDVAEQLNSAVEKALPKTAVIENVQISQIDGWGDTHVELLVVVEATE